MHKLMQQFRMDNDRTSETSKRRAAKDNRVACQAAMMSAKSIYMYDVLYERVNSLRGVGVSCFIDEGSLLPVNIGLCQRYLWKQMEAT